MRGNLIRRQPRPKYFAASFALLTFLILFLTHLCPLHAQISNWESRIIRKARFTSGGFRYIPLHDIADVFNAHTYYSSKVRKAVLYLGEERITVTAYNPFVIVGTETRQMPINTKFDDGDILVPVKFFMPILRQVIGTTNVNDDVLFERIPTLNPTENILGVSVEEKANGTLIRVKTTQPFDKSSISTRTSRRWLYLDVLNGTLDKQTFQTVLQSGLVKKVVPEQQKQIAQISFQLTKDIPSKKISLTRRTREILLSIPTKEKLSPDLVAKLQSDREKWKIDRIVIDPGHGGKDPGAIGTRGVYEKDIVLGIAKRLKKMIESNLDIEVFMTRNSDRFISLKERTQFSNQKEGKLFISIHANWNRNRSVEGTTTYFLGLARTDEALEIASRENAVIRYEDNEGDYAELTDETIILATMAQNAYNKESQDFAGIIQAALNNRTGLRDRGVKQAGFHVLVGASMPNVLVETAFISNKKEENLLKKASFQQKVAKGLFESIVAFKKKYEQDL
ncbi:MAG: N-acetylmuramoyl-L-alanine amidase [bacterium]